MKKKLLILLLLFSTLSYCSEITGSVFLNNTSDHSGIIIKFNPISPSAVYTEGTSNASGLYNITVNNGIYNISFEKNGYQTYTLNNQFISTNSTLSIVNLNSNTAVNVLGNVSGNWVKTNTYFVNGDITIPLGQTLTIEPGTEIKFNGYYSLIVNGTLTAIGEDNSNIKFTSAINPPSKEDWNQILFNNSSTLSELKYCTIEYGKKPLDNRYNGIVQILGKANVIDCTIRNSGGSGIYVSTNENILITKNSIENCDMGVYMVHTAGVFNVTNNKINNIRLNGIENGVVSVNSIIENNIIGNCSNIGILNWSSSRIRFNIVYNSSTGIHAGKGVSEITQNTLISNRNGITVHYSESFNANPIINSNIIANSSDYAIYSVGPQKPLSVTYNLFYNNTKGIGNNNLPIGVGTIITTNNNGINSDTYYNIFSSPDLVSINPADSEFCKLNSNSIAINAGDPAITNNNSTIIDIGAKESLESLSTKKFSNNNFTAFPNPIISQVKIEAKTTQLFDQLILNGINGQIVKEYKLENSTNEYTLENLNELETGIYFLTIYNKSQKIQQIKLLKK
ncbi:MAG TPA: right-handed parallel beta-helix repeat-containing protein [Flavobacterium sp.]